MKQLDPKAVWLFFIQRLIGFVILFSILGIMFGFTLFAALSETGLLSTFAVPGFLAGAIVIIFLLLFSFLTAKLSYSNYKYELREDGFRKESGIILKKYVTVPYERIQNVDIYRGLIPRMLGLSDLQIQTAGYSGNNGKGGGSEGRLPAISTQEAEELRDKLIRRSKGQVHQTSAASQTQPSTPSASNQGL